MLPDYKIYYTKNWRHKWNKEPSKKVNLYGFFHFYSFKNIILYTDV